MPNIDATLQTDELLTTREAAAMIGVAPATLRDWRWANEPGSPSYLRLGARTVRYRRSALVAFLQGCEVHPGQARAGNGRGGSQ